MMKRGDSLVVDVVLGAALLIAGTVAWRRLEVSNRWAWEREARKAETGEGVVFQYARVENCPQGAGRAEKTLRRSLAATGPKETTFKLYESPTTRTGPRARRPYVYSIFFPASYGDAVRDGDRDPVPVATRKLTLPTGIFFTVRRTREGDVTHGSAEGSHTHRTVTYTWSSPRSPATVLSYTREAGTLGMDAPPLRPEDLPADAYFEWEMLESIGTPGDGN